MFAPAGTPRDFVKRAAAKLRKIVLSKNMNDPLTAQDTDAIAGAVANLRERVHTDFVKAA
jgi:tripartite-type tricarboxylate transporter receptor subunit TctC